MPNSDGKKRRKNASPYGGGFNKGKNTSEYNHNYYMRNKFRWLKKEKDRTMEIIRENANLAMKEIRWITQSVDPIISFIRGFHNLVVNNPVVLAFKRVDWDKEIDTESIDKSFGNARSSFGEGLEAFKRVMKK